jgi:hypothetical protein
VSRQIGKLRRRKPLPLGQTVEFRDAYSPKHPQIERGGVLIGS